MSKEKENKFVDIEDPLVSLGFDDEAEEVIEDIEDTEEIIEEIEEETESKLSLAERLAPIKEKAAEILKPVTDIASKKISVKNTAIILCNVVAIAVIAAILIFSFYSSATYTSGRSVSEWTDEWNEISFSDSCTYMLYSSYQGRAAMETLMISDTDHVYLTDDDVKALKKGETVSLFNDTAQLSIDTYKGDFKSATMSIDYEDLCDYYFGEDYVYDSHVYAPDFFEDSTFRVLSYLSVFMNPLNDNLNGQNDLLTAAIDLYLANGLAYNYNGSNRMDFDDYSVSLYYTEEDNLVITSDSDISASDVSATDTSASDISASIETHLIINITYEYTKAGEKKHAADWSWWNEIFPKKEEKEPSIYDNVDELTDVVSDSELSASDASATDVSVTDAE